jgi:lantibiotic modifying enzyme
MSLWEDAVFNNSTSGSSVYTGLGGVLYMYLMQYRITNSKEYLDYAKQTARKLKKRIESKREYQEKDCTFLSGRAGSFALLAVVADLSKEDWYFLFSKLTK